MQLKFDTWIKIILLAVIFLNTACSSLNYSSNKEQNLKRYELALPTDLTKNLNPQGKSLLIYPVQSNNIYKTLRIAYRLNTYEISYYAQNEWADTPENLLSPLLIATAENTGKFSSVVSSGSSAVTDLALDAEILSLIHQYNNDRSTVVFSVRVQLIDLRKRQVIATNRLSIEEPAPSNDPYGAVVATNAAAGKLMQS